MAKKQARMGCESEFEFQNGLSTWKALLPLQILVYHYRDVNCDIFICFLNYITTFDRCQHIEMLKILKDCDFFPHIFNLYSERIFKKALEGIDEQGLIVNGEIITNIFARY